MCLPTNSTTAASAASAGSARVRKSLADYRLYRQTRDELENLNARELHDLGLSRFSIRQVAYDSVYGA